MFVEFDEWQSDGKVLLNVFHIVKVEVEPEEDDGPTTAIRIVGERDAIYVKGTYSNTVTKINAVIAWLLSSFARGHSQ